MKDPLTAAETDVLPEDSVGPAREPIRSQLTRVFEDLVLGTAAAALSAAAIWWLLASDARNASESLLNSYAGPMVLVSLGPGGACAAAVLVTVGARRKPTVTFILSAFIFGFLLTLFAGQASRAVVIETWSQFAIRAKPVIEAIERYDRENGRPPSDPSDLVPKYLASLPRVPGGLRMEIVPPDRIEEGGKDRWRLLVMYIPSPGSFGDVFAFHPSGEYPDYGYGGGLERVGKWGYYWE